ncbi:MAG: sporulation protein [Ruminococcus sp.]|jgi:sporulation protein YqfC|nr:sporulation protein [Ruminococcus sp.]
MNYEQENGGLKSRLASAANMPKDVVLGASVVTILGDSEVCIENYRGIVEYTECLIRVQTKGKQLRLHGRNLQIEYYTNDEMKITGHICSLEYCK